MRPLHNLCLQQAEFNANSGFWQIPLADSSRLLTTFITPFGHYCFNKLPFGISSAPELFQKRMGQILEGLDGVLCQMDDVLVFGSNQQEHDFKLHAVLKAIKAAGVTLNSEKCSFSVDKLKFLRHVISRDGVSADPDKTKAILQMKPPTNITELYGKGQLSACVPSVYGRNMAAIVSHHWYQALPHYV